MNQSTVAAAILAIGLLGAAFLFGGRYQIVRVSDDSVMRLDKWGGEVSICAQWEDDSAFCVPMPDAVYDPKADPRMSPAERNPQASVG